MTTNNAAADLFALKPEEIMGKSTGDLGFSCASNFKRSLENVIVDQSIWPGKFVHTFASGQDERFEYLLAPVLDEPRNTEAAVCISQDGTERALAEEQQWRNNNYDLLTGLPNRRLFLDRLEQEVKHAKRSNLPISVLFMNLDGFREINDSFGHEAGDQLLADVGDRLTDCVRAEDSVARLGGDEFAVILTGTKQQKNAELVAQTVIDALALPFQIAQQSVQIYVSIGISVYPWHASSPVALLQAAGRAMYNAKKTGHNRMCFVNTPDEPQEIRL